MRIAAEHVPATNVINDWRRYSEVWGPDDEDDVEDEEWDDEEWDLAA
jgi:hypothetical protein